MIAIDLDVKRVISFKCMKFLDSSIESMKESSKDKFLVEEEPFKELSFKEEIIDPST